MGVAPTAVVTVADDGGSSGRLRRDLGIIALGDLRMALLALAREEALADVLTHRFARGHLEGHALGNLLLVALAERAAGDVVEALRVAEQLLGCEGQVLPSTTEPVEIVARVAGERVTGQAAITRSRGPLEELTLEPREPAACADAVAAVRAADAVVLGPGSLFTSVIVNLLVPDLRRAVCETAAPLVHVANVQAPPGESAQLSLRDHVTHLRAALEGRQLDVVVMHDGPQPDGPGTPLAPVDPLPGAARVVTADLLRREPDGTVTTAHDPARLATGLSAALAPASDTVAAGP